MSQSLLFFFFFDISEKRFLLEMTETSMNYKSEKLVNHWYSISTLVFQYIKKVDAIPYRDLILHDMFVQRDLEMINIEV